MDQTRTCPNCRCPVPPDAPEGVCPACALRAGFHIDESGVSRPALDSPGAPAIEELARQLPELDGFELIGRGGMGAVYRARHRRLERTVAVKVLDAALRGNAQFAERFTREARAMAQLDHPNVVAVYDFGQREGFYYLVMEYVDGVDLRQTIEAATLDPREALSMVPYLCDALQYAHDRGVIHRDIKPENILVDRNGTIKIADFGLAKLVRNEGGPRLTRTEQIMGTPNYMAPEQIESPAQVDHRADIFALGVVFYEMLTGELPVGRFPPPSRKVEVDVRLDEVVLRTLEKEPSLRYHQASDLRSDVESLKHGRAPLPRPRAAPLALGGAHRQPYEFRSRAELFGLPLVHIALSRDPEGKSLRTARGIIAIGDVAVGGVALGGFSFGLVSLGGISVGLLGIGGVTLGLLAALGGVSFGTFAVGGFSAALIASQGPAHFSAFSLGEALHWRAMLMGWCLLGFGLLAGAGAAAFAWLRSTRAPAREDR